MKLATWNVNSLNVRLGHVQDWLAENPVDVLCLQETKLVDEKFPASDFTAAGYSAVYAGQKTYNGVAILTRMPLVCEEVVAGIPGSEDPQKRLLAATVGGVRILCAYFPNGQTLESEKYQYKLQWIDTLIAWLADEMKKHPELALLGDYNIAPEDRDVHDPAAWLGQVLVSEPERARFRALEALGLTDAFRLFPQAEKSYSWWDYRMLAFRRNRGLRIDHILLSESLRRICTSCVIDKLPRKREQPSDHTPVVVELTR
ncbi:MAG: exodeoxyribonuclease III [Burkholderiaceae bacterium]